MHVVNQQQVLQILLHYLLLSWQADCTSGAAMLASHNKMWWATPAKKCWHAYFSLPSSVRIKQPILQGSLCCVLSIPQTVVIPWVLGFFLGDLFFLNWSSYSWRVGCLIDAKGMDNKNIHMLLWSNYCWNNKTNFSFRAWSTMAN